MECPSVQLAGSNEAAAVKPSSSQDGRLRVPLVSGFSKLMLAASLSPNEAYAVTEPTASGIKPETRRSRPRQADQKLDEHSHDFEGEVLSIVKAVNGRRRSAVV